MQSLVNALVGVCMRLQRNSSINNKNSRCRSGCSPEDKRKMNSHSMTREADGEDEKAILNSFFITQSVTVYGALHTQSIFDIVGST